MSERQSRGRQSRRRSVVLAAIAFIVGTTILVARYSADWTRDPDENPADLPLHRKVALTVGQPLQLLDCWIYDFIHSFGKKMPQDPDVVVLGIDEASLALENSSAFPEDIAASRPLQMMNEVFPWSREVYKHVIDRVIGAGAETIVIDLTLPAPSEKHPAGDELLRDTLEKHRGKVIIAADIGTSETNMGEREIVQLPYEGLIEPKWPADERVGFITYWAEVDGVIRRAVYRYEVDARMPEKSLPSFVAAALISQGRGDRVPKDTNQHFVRFGDSLDYAPVSLHEIFVPSLWESNFEATGFFKGKTVFLGPIARQLQDIHSTPLGKIPGVQIHAHVYAATKAGQMLHEPPDWVMMTLVVLAAFAAWALVSFCKKPMLVTGLIFAGLLAGLLLQWLLFNHSTWFIHAGSPMLAFALIGVLGFSYDFLLERRQKTALKRSIMRFHSPDVAEQIVQHPETYFSIREGATRSIVILFSDVRGYTSLSEVLTAQQMVSQLNEYFERMVSIVFQRKGAVDKFIGDALMAVWGRFRDHPQESHLVDDACNSVASALAMREGLVQLNVGWRERQMTELSIGIGIHQGEAVVGEIGSEEKAEITAIGDCVNLGSRLEGATKEYGLDLLISETVHARVVEKFVCRTVDLLRVKGKKKPVEVFTVLSTKEVAPPRALDLYEEGMRFYRQGRFADAQWIFQQAAKDGLEDDLTRVFIKRCADLQETPPENWDGVFTMTKK
jgi:adenylate cyclase